MSVAQAVILGLVQGLTEFLPISSSGHLVLFSKFPFWAAQPLVFDTTLHLATGLTLITYFRKDLFRLITAFLYSAAEHKISLPKYSEDARLMLLILCGSIPAGLLGLLFENLFETQFRSPHYVALFLFIGTVLLILGQKFGLKNYGLAQLTFKKSFVIGLFQSLALFPGVSRAGATISGGLLMGLDRTVAAKFSFLLSIPIVLVAGVYKISTTDWTNMPFGLEVLLAGLISSYVSGLAVVHFLLAFLKKHTFTIFIIYRLLLIACVLVVF